MGKEAGSCRGDKVNCTAVLTTASLGQSKREVLSLNQPLRVGLTWDEGETFDKRSPKRAGSAMLPMAALLTLRRLSFLSLR